MLTRRLIGCALVLCGGAYGARCGCQRIRDERQTAAELTSLLRELLTELTYRRRKLSECFEALSEKYGHFKPVLTALAEELHNSPSSPPHLPENALPADVRQILEEVLPHLGSEEAQMRAALENAVSRSEAREEARAAREKDELRVMRGLWLGGSAAAAILLG